MEMEKAEGLNKGESVISLIK